MDTPAKRLKWAREHRSAYKTASDAARAFGWTVPTYLGHENGDRNPSREAAKRYADAYKVPWSWILEGGPLPEAEPPHLIEERPATMPEPEPLPRTIAQPVPHTNSRPDVPVWASAEAGNDGAMVLVNDPIDWIRRSERMQGVKAPFAFYVIGTSMSPSIDHGDQVVINPSLLPTAGKDHVFLQTQEDGTILALVKRLLRSSGSTWKVRQFNPPRDFDLSRKQWPKAHVVSEVKRGGL